jgi:uncharacterized protein
MAAKLTTEAKRVIAEQRLAFVATVCPDGTPNVSPKGTIAVWDDDHLVFADIRSPRTIANIRQNPAVELNVVDPFSRKGYRFKGTAEIVSDKELSAKIFDFYRSRRGNTGNSNPAPVIRGFVLVKVERVLPLISPAYDDGTDEKTIRARWVSYFSALHQETDKGSGV